MKPHDRVINTITLRGPDRAPIMHSPLPGALIKYGERLNDIFYKYPQDFGPSIFEIPKPENLPPNYKRGVHKDEWGTVWISSIDGIHGQVYDYPLKSWDDLKKYDFPPFQEATSSYQIQGLIKAKARISELKDKGYFTILGFSPGNFYERMQWLRGFKNLLIDFVRNLNRVHELADMLLVYCLRSIEFVLDAKPDAVSLADDWGTQDKLMVKPDFWRDFFKPRYKEMFKLIHDGSAYVYFHSDGYILDIIPDLIEVGVDIINPQFSCFKLEELAQVVNEKVCVASDIDRQYVLPRGSIEDVDKYVKKVVELFSNEGRGGLICRGEVGVDVPLENVEAMYMAFEKYGRYKGF